MPAHPFPTTPRSLTLTLFIQTPLGTRSNHAYFELDAGDTAPVIGDMVTVANDAFTAFSGPVAHILSASVLFAQIVARYRSGSQDYEGVSSEAAVAGFRTGGDGMPDQDVFEIRKVTGQPGRQKRGRVFISGCNEVDNIEGKLNPASYDLFAAAAAPFGADLTAGGSTWHARHWDRKDSLLVPIQAVYAMSIFYSQRKRRRPLRGIPVS